MKNRIIKPSYKREDERGLLLEIVKNKPFVDLLYGKMKKGSIIGNHYHKKTLEFLHLLEGKAHIYTKNIKNGKKLDFILNKGEGISFDLYESISIEFLYDSKLLLFNNKTFDKDNPDIYNYIVKEKYGKKRI